MVSRVAMIGSRSRVTEILTGMIAPGVALICFGLLHWAGMGLTSDGWAAWQGAVSLSSGFGYTYFSGNPIVAWPPLYAGYICLWTLLLGPTGWSLLVSNGVMLAAQAWLWVHFTKAVAKDSGVPLSSRSFIALSVFVGVVVTLHQRDTNAQHLMYTLLPGFLLGAWKLTLDYNWSSPPRLPWLVACLGALMILSHNAAIAFVVAVSILVASTCLRLRSWKNAVNAAFILAIPLIAAQSSRMALGQVGSHHMGIGAGRYSTLAYVGQTFEGLMGTLAPAVGNVRPPVLLLFLGAIILLAKDERGKGLRFCLYVASCATFVIFLLFNVTWIFNPISGYLAFIPLLLVPLSIATMANTAPRAALAALCIISLPQFYWSLNWMTLQQTKSQFELGFTGDVNSIGFVPPTAYLDRSYRNGSPMKTRSGLLVAPNVFEEPPGRRD